MVSFRFDSRGAPGVIGFPLFFILLIKNNKKKKTFFLLKEEQYLFLHLIVLVY